MTIAVPTGSRVFRAPMSKSRNNTGSVVPSAAWWESTPVDATTTAPAMRTVLELFSEALDPCTTDRVLVVRNPERQNGFLATAARISCPVVFISVSHAQASATEALDETSDVLIAFDRLQSELGLSQKELFAITGIKKRTYHSWQRKPDSRPRLSSLGALWRVADAVDDLREAVGRPLAQWIHAAPARQKALREGQLDELVDMAVAFAEPTHRRYGRSNRVGIAADIELPIVRSGRPDAHDDEDELSPWG